MKETPRSVLDTVNQIVSSHYDAPEKTVSGYRLWFREYVPSQTNTRICGFAIAWPPPNTPKEQRRYFVALAGKDYVAEYKAGASFPMDDVLTDIANVMASKDPVGFLVAAKEAAMERLEKFVVEQTA